MERKQSELEAYLEQHKDKFNVIMDTPSELTQRGDWLCYHFKVVINGVPVDYYMGSAHVEMTEAAVRLLGSMRAKPDGTHEVFIAGEWTRDPVYLRTVPPTLGDVLSSLALDAEAESMSFTDWCDNFGYNTDSRKDLATYLECQESGRKLRQILRGTGINAGIIRALEH